MKWIAEPDTKPEQIVLFLAEALFKEGMEGAQRIINRSNELVLNVKLDRMARAGHEMLFFSFKGVRYVMKLFADTKGHSLGRRLEFYLLNLLRDPALKSYQGARLLQQAGIPVICPVACLTGWEGFKRKGVFIYLEQQADATLADWYHSGASDSLQRAVFIKLAELVKVMDLHHLRQTDFTKGNVLISFSPETSDVSLCLIDTDDVYKRNIDWLPKSLQVRAKFWFLRRLRPDEVMSRVFLQAYLGHDFSEEVLRQWLVIRESNFNPLKALRRKLRARG